MVLKEFEQITLALLKNGNVNSYCLCYDLYFGALCSYANNIIKEPAVAEELVQELFLGIWQNREKLPENSSLKGYLLTAVRNDCLDFLKHKKIEKQYAEEYIRNNPVSYENIFNDLVDSEIQLSLRQPLKNFPTGAGRFSL
jgi:RNA polymerase sigma-70 factor (ECF subfamily)